MIKERQCSYGLSENNFGIGCHQTVFCIRRNGHSGYHVTSSFEPDLDNELMILNSKGEFIKLVIMRKGNEGI